MFQLVMDCVIRAAYILENYVSELRIRDTYPTHSYLLKDQSSPICKPCNYLLTVEHILISYVAFDIIF